MSEDQNNENHSADRNVVTATDTISNMAHAMIQIQLRDQLDRGVTTTVADTTRGGLFGALHIGFSQTNRRRGGWRWTAPVSAACTPAASGAGPRP